MRDYNNYPGSTNKTYSNFPKSTIEYTNTVKSMYDIYDEEIDEIHLNSERTKIWFLLILISIICFIVRI